MDPPVVDRLDRVGAVRGAAFGGRMVRWGMTPRSRATTWH